MKSRAVRRLQDSDRWVPEELQAMIFHTVGATSESSRTPSLAETCISGACCCWNIVKGHRDSHSKTKDSEVRDTTE